MLHLEFVCELYRDQVAAGRYFLHEHPETATSWDERCMKEVSNLPGVSKVIGDQCQFGQEYEHEPIKKATGWLSNAMKVLEALSLRCSGRGGACSRSQGGTHRTCNGAVAKASQVYPVGLCRAILKGFRNQLVEDGRMIVGVVGIQRPEERSADEGPEGRSGALLCNIRGAEFRGAEGPEGRSGALLCNIRGAEFRGEEACEQQLSPMPRAYAEGRTLCPMPCDKELCPMPRAGGQVEFRDAITGQPLRADMVRAAWYMLAFAAFHSGGQTRRITKWLFSNSNARSRISFALLEAFKIRMLFRKSCLRFWEPRPSEQGGL